MMVTKLIEAHPVPTDEEIRHYLTGNLCRCSAYPEIVEAVKLAASRMKPAEPVSTTALG
jgi:carbon-monoxide dehydrogenase small subunit